MQDLAYMSTRELNNAIVFYKNKINEEYSIDLKKKYKNRLSQIGDELKRRITLDRKIDPDFNFYYQKRNLTSIYRVESDDQLYCFERYSLDDIEEFTCRNYDIVFRLFEVDLIHNIKRFICYLHGFEYKNNTCLSCYFKVKIDEREYIFLSNEDALEWLEMRNLKNVEIEKIENV